MEETVKTLESLIESNAQVNWMQDGGPYLLLRQDQRVEDMEKYCEKPMRKRGYPHFTRMDSFIRYVNLHQSERTQIFAFGMAFEAVLDHHSEKEPGWMQHRAQYALVPSLQSKAWATHCKLHMTQLEFAEFIEANLADFTAPKAVELVELVRQLQVSSQVEFKSFEKADNGNTEVHFVRTTQARAGEKGSVELPKGFLISIPLFEGAAKQDIAAKLRFDISSGNLQLWYELQRWEQAITDATEAIAAAISKQTGQELFYGKP